MKKTTMLLFAFLASSAVNAQTSSIPYPVIFVHGLNDSHEAFWGTGNTAESMKTILHLPPPQVAHVCLNHDGHVDASNLATDVYFVGWTDYGSTIVRTAPYDSTRLVLVNFDQTKFPDSNHLTHAESNQSAIMKQGKALGLIISAVRNATGMDKVILVGHSMGGLAIREYLQRTADGTIGTPHLWWVTQDADGHKVAKVLTLGTPHRGGLDLTVVGTWPGVDLHSEAIRDLLTGYAYVQADGSTTPLVAPYLFGGMESNAATTKGARQDDIYFYNNDINTDGIANSMISGINVPNDGTRGSVQMPLPTNTSYIWIRSDGATPSQQNPGDGVVELDRQWLYETVNSNQVPSPIGAADTLLSHKDHADEAKDYSSVLRGLDEPDLPGYYDIALGKGFYGTITYVPGGSSLDRDAFRMLIDHAATLQVTLDGTNSGITAIEIAPDHGFPLTASITGARNIVATDVQPGYCFVRISGTATSISAQNPYRLLAELVSLPSAPTLSAPANGSAGIAMNPTLSWNTVAGATSYHLQVSLDASFATPLLDQNNLTSTSLALSGLAANKLYYWRLSASNSAGTSPSSTIWSFTTIAAPTSFPIYQNAALTSPWNDIRSWSVTRTYTNTTPVYEGSSSLRIGYSPWGSLQFSQGTWGSFVSIDPSVYQGFDFAIHGGTTGVTVAVRFLGPSGSGLKTAIQVAAPANAWLVQSIPMSQLASTPFIAIEFSAGGSSKTFYLDNVVLTGGSASLAANAQVGIEEVLDQKNTIPASFSVGQNYPNPFNPTTVISYEIPTESHVSLRIYNEFGQEVARLVEAQQKAGYYRAVWSAGVSSGVYYYRLRAGVFLETRKMVLLR
jgi:pimeloyl-ACP methyl ester carboxylesterase